MASFHREIASQYLEVKKEIRLKRNEYSKKGKEYSIQIITQDGLHSRQLLFLLQT